MDLLTTVMWCIAAAVGGLILNILAADTYDRCPRLAAWLLARSVARLPEDKRDRYREEWASHLAECVTKLDQVRHAIGAWWSVSGILSQGPRVKFTLCLDYIIVGTALMAVANTGEAVLRLLAGMPIAFILTILTQTVPEFIVLVLAFRLRREKGNIIEYD